MSWHAPNCWLWRAEPLHALKQEPRYAALLERLKAATGTKPDDAGRKAN